MFLIFINYIQKSSDDNNMLKNKNGQFLLFGDIIIYICNVYGFCSLCPEYRIIGNQVT